MFDHLYAIEICQWTKRYQLHCQAASWIILAVWSFSYLQYSRPSYIVVHEKNILLVRLRPFPDCFLGLKTRPNADLHGCDSNKCILWPLVHIPQHQMNRVPRFGDNKRQGVHGGTGIESWVTASVRWSAWSCWWSADLGRQRYTQLHQFHHF